MRENIVGNKYGRLIVLSQIPKGIYNQRMFECLCDCGNKKIVSYTDLKHGKIKSCGCLQRDVSRERATKHNMSYKPLYNSYNNMKERCTNPNHHKYYRYGGRGIKICDEWLGENGFKNFSAWALKNGYCENLSIDRIDNDGNYEPSNCRWTTIKEQNRNRSTTHFVCIGNVRLCVTDLADKCGINRRRLSYKLSKGLNPVEAINSLKGDLSWLTN